MKFVLIFTLILCQPLFGKTCSEQWQEVCGNNNSFKCFTDNKQRFEDRCQDRFVMDPSLAGNEEGCLHKYEKICKKGETVDLCLKNNSKKFSEECFKALANSFEQANALEQNCAEVFTKICPLDRSKPPAQGGKEMLSCIARNKNKIPKNCHQSMQQAFF